MLETEQGKAITKKYLTVARSMREYWENIYERWKEQVEHSATNYLKAYVLRKETQADGTDRIRVNFRPELHEIIRETKYLDRMGFLVPEAALNVALQEEKYHSYVEQLNTMLNAYHEVFDSLNEAERKLLSTGIMDLRRTIGSGASRLNWTSLGILDFIQRCNLEINKFSSVVAQVHKNANSIMHTINMIARATLLSDPPSKEEEMLDVHVRLSISNNSHLELGVFHIHE